MAKSGKTNARPDELAAKPGNRSVPLDGARCRSARIAKGLNREQLAAASRGGLSIATIKRVESGTPVYLDTARRFAALVDAPVASLVAPSDDGALNASEHATPATIAVLPFEVMNENEAGAGWFADGLIEGVITRLGRQWFPVIGRSSTFRYRGTRTDPHVVRAELGADYVIEGSIHRSGDRLRVTARLTDTTTGVQLWADSYDRTMGDVFDVQDSLVAAIVEQAHGVVFAKESRPLLHRNPKDLSAWELSLRARFYFHQRTREGNEQARALFEEALQRDSDLVLAWYFLVMTHQRSIINQWSANAGQSLADMKRVCADFPRKFSSEPRFHLAIAYCDVYSGDRASAISHLREAIGLDPNFAPAYSLYGQTLAMGEKPDEAIEQFEQAMRLSPRDDALWSFLSGAALCHFVSRDYDEMLQSAERAILSKDDMPFPHGILAVAQINLGNEEAARIAARRMQTLEPKTSLRGMKPILVATSPTVAERYLDGLRRAGVPE